MTNYQLCQAKAQKLLITNYRSESDSAVLVVSKLKGVTEH